MLILCLDVHQHLGDRGCASTHVSKGQVGEEEVPGGVEVGVQADSQDEEQVPQDGDQVHRQEEPKDEGLQFWTLCQSQEKEF